jgi:hypothetical protein
MIPDWMDDMQEPIEADRFSDNLFVHEDHDDFANYAPAVHVPIGSNDHRPDPTEELKALVLNHAGKILTGALILLYLLH